MWTLLEDHFAHRVVKTLVTNCASVFADKHVASNFERRKWVELLPGALNICDILAERLFLAGKDCFHWYFIFAGGVYKHE